MNALGLQYVQGIGRLAQPLQTPSLTIFLATISKLINFECAHGLMHVVLLVAEFLCARLDLRVESGKLSSYSESSRWELSG